MERKILHIPLQLWNQLTLVILIMEQLTSGSRRLNTYNHTTYNPLQYIQQINKSNAIKLRNEALNTITGSICYMMSSVYYLQRNEHAMIEIQHNMSNNILPTILHDTTTTYLRHHNQTPR
jgi:hypothetical protein